MGDFNLYYIDINSLKSNMEVLGLSQVIKQPTGYSALNPPALIRYTNSTTISNSGMFSLNISDHGVIFLTRQKHKIMTKFSFK